MAKGVTIQVFDKGFKHIMREIRKLEDRPFIKAGVQGAKGLKKEADGKLTVVQVAVYNEFGAPKANIPERAFIRSTHDTKSKEWFELVKKLKDLIYKGLSLDQALGILGLKMQTDIKDRIKHSRDWAKANSQSTYLRKLKKGGKPGEVVPLIDTGQMLNSITFVKVMKSSEGE